MSPFGDVARNSIPLAATAALLLGCAFAPSGESPAFAEVELLVSSGKERLEVAVPFDVIAHRGASAAAPENTLPAFAIAREMGATSVELDVRMSADGVLVLFHDATLDGKTALSGRVADHPASTLLATEIGTWFDDAHETSDRRYAGTTIPTLSSLFEEHGPALHYHVELKGDQPELPSATLERIAAHDLLGSVTITSFNFDHLERVRALDARVRICLLLRDPRVPYAEMTDAQRAKLLETQRERVDRAVRAGFTQVGIRAAALSPEIVDYVQRERGLLVRGWGVRSTAEMEKVIAVGANGMTIDWPDRLLARLRELEQSIGVETEK